MVRIPNYFPIVAMQGLTVAFAVLLAATLLLKNIPAGVPAVLWLSALALQGLAAGAGVGRVEPLGPPTLGQ